eukprot:NODE_9374_length_1428_cov_6.269792.p1 GENE.NODE_9374_length_1428_cov_6.269792~~NODE_9374_length_1428_cov_6.269792.p1  ORF type:complete len:281 (-),score=43.11 NODE_9374_length_1428_cov_6.269792:429-1271(-)
MTASPRSASLIDCDLAWNCCALLRARTTDLQLVEAVPAVLQDCSDEPVMTSCSQRHDDTLGSIPGEGEAAPVCGSEDCDDAVPSEGDTSHPQALHEPYCLKYRGIAGLFNVRVVKAPGMHIGLTIDLLDNCAALVIGVQHGAVQTWNAACSSEDVVRCGDRIVEVNGDFGDSQVLVGRLQADDVVDMWLLRPTEICMELPMTRESSLGLSVHFAPEGTMVRVVKVTKGPIKSWNEQHLNKQICTNDRLIEVNSVRGQADELLRLLEEYGTVKLIFLHYSA